MSEPDRPRRRWISLGELIALGALAVSALGLWLTWKNSGQDKPTRIVEQRQPVPLTLRGHVERDGRTLVIEPVEQGHALDSLTIAIAGAPPIEVGSDGQLDADSVEAAIRDREGKGTQKLPVRIAARYVEMGADRRGGGGYVIRYRWEGGGIFGGRSLRFVGFSR
jgi:hypothetical protein